MTLVLVPFLGACATVSPGSRPDDMSASHHRAVAKQHEREATKDAKRYDPNAEAYRPRRGGGGGANTGDTENFDVPHNPTAVHLGHAQEHKEHARQHLAAAQTLERFEGDACRKVPKDKRAACPLLGQVQRVQDIPDGVRIYMVKGVQVKTALAQMKCHYAYGRVMARKGMDRCPLYLKDLTIRADQAYRFVEITSKDAQVVREIQRRMKLHVSP